MDLDCAAVFRARAQDLGLEEPHVNALAGKGWDMFSRFAFASSHTPGNPDDSSYIEAVQNAVLGTGDQPLAPVLKRLYFEAYTAVAADLRRKWERTEGDAPRKMPMPERQGRYERQQAKLTGPTLTGELEPSRSLVDKAVHVVDENSVVHIEWHTCTSRTQEMEGTKLLVEWKPNASGVITERTTEVPGRTLLITDLRLQNALEKRGLAMDQAALLSFQVHDKWVERMFQAMMTDPPPGYSRVSVQQMYRADKEVFRVLAEHTRGGIKSAPRSLGENYLDRLFQQACSGALDATIPLLLLPLAQKAGAGEKRKSPGETRSSQAYSRNAKGSVRAQPRGGKGDAGGKGKKGKGKGSGKSHQAGKGKRNAYAPPMPVALRGCDHQDSNGQNTCFAYNLDGCNAAGDGGQCPKGRHVCCSPGCYKPFSFSSHPH